jgi:dihydrofolate synthase/folylpolyglutamate synthase
MANPEKIEQKILAYSISQKAVYSGPEGISILRDFLAFIENPEKKFYSFHIVGTSGKGSTAICLSKLLQAQGLKAGLMQSPHLLDIRERFMINNQLISRKKLSDYFTALQKKINLFKKKTGKQLNFFQIMTALAFYIFQKEGIRFVVIEAGIGGLYDSTNVLPLKNKIVIITKIGKDHTEILGNKISEIAYQKAMVMGPGTIAISAPQSSTAKKTIAKIAKEKNTALYFKNQFIYNIKHHHNIYSFSLKNKSILLEDLEIKNDVSYQFENYTLALSALTVAAIFFNFQLKEKPIRNILLNLKIPGRMEIIKNNTTEIVLDAAHNPQKIRTLIEALKRKYPRQKFTFIISFKEGKDTKMMLTLLAPFAHKIIITDFNHDNLLSLKAVNPEIISKYLVRLNFKRYLIVPETYQAIFCTKKEKNQILICGSIYLLRRLIPEIKKSGFLFPDL